MSQLPNKRSTGGFSVHPSNNSLGLSIEDEVSVRLFRCVSFHVFDRFHKSDDVFNPCRVIDWAPEYVKVWRVPEHVVPPVLPLSGKSARGRHARREVQS